MNISVCFNVAGDMEALSPADWVAADDLTVDLSFVPKKPGCYDESALEFGLRIAGAARAAAEETVLSAVSIGGWELKRWMKTLYAVGYDRCILASAQEDMRFDPEGLAEILFAIDAVKNSSLILLGEKSCLGGSGQVGPFLAEKLGLPFFGGISALCYEGGQIRFSAVSGDCLVTRQIPPRAVLAIGNAPFSMLRVPTLKDRMNVSGAVIGEYSADYRQNCASAKLFSLEPAKSAMQRPALQVKETLPEKTAETILSLIRGALE